MIIGSKIIFRENLSSTNTYLDQLLKSQDLQEGTVVYASYQSDGKGQAGNSWESEPGKNLLMSILLMPAMIEPDEQFLLSKCISAGICDFLRKHVPSCRIKWPNDIYVNDDKIAGILIENILLEDKIQYSIAGIGLNINQEKFSSAVNPVSLSILTGKSYSIESCLNELSSALDYRYRQMQYDPDKLSADYHSYLYRLNETHRYSDCKGIFTGKIIRVSESGKLQIEKSSGDRYEYSFREVDFIL